MLTKLYVPGHHIRNAKTKRHAALFHMEAQRRWCMSGTPIQNSLDDLKSLVVFLRASPDQDDGKFFNTYITDPLQKYEQRGVDNLRLLMGSICLRRTNSILNLPPLVEEKRSVYMTIQERTQYDQFSIETSKAIQDAVERGLGLGLLNILQLITKLRVFCNLGFHMKQLNTAKDLIESAQDMVINVCAEQDCRAEIDRDASPPPELLSCFHWICSLCANALGIRRKKRRNKTCPACLAALPIDINMGVDTDDIITNQTLVSSEVNTSNYVSSKIKTVLEELRSTPDNS